MLGQRSGQQGLQVVKSLVDGRYDSLDNNSQGQLRDGHIVTHLGERHVRPQGPVEVGICWTGLSPDCK